LAPAPAASAPPGGPPTAQPTAQPTIESARQLLDRGQLAEAERELVALRASGDSAAIQEALSEVAERRGNRLAALAHQHRATRMQPQDPSVRAHLALLLLRLGQPEQACRQARALLEIDPRGPGAVSARGILEQARCKEAR
jgi:Flp pilus assembly protein TadD